MLEGVVHFRADALVGEVDLHAAAAVLQCGKAGLAHHAFQHHAAGKGGLDAGGLQVFLGFSGVRGMQCCRLVLAGEVVGEGDALLAHPREFLAPLGDDLVFVLRHGSGGLLGHRMFLLVTL